MAALEQIKLRIPAGASIMNGHSTTLEEIGFVDHVAEEDHNWRNLHDEIFAIDDEAKPTQARRESQAADYFLGSDNAIAASGELVAADAAGSRVDAYPFAAANFTLITGGNRIPADLETPRYRLEKVAYRFEDVQTQDEYGLESQKAKEFSYHHELEDDRSTVMLIDSRLGF
ncbi:LUD domain-containing protein [Halobellus sp.]|uniref:LUD domain-containing protein n=1 Tax=Halobellus sp. TaxID=1979212 RepID=UPI0035D512B9